MSNANEILATSMANYSPTIEDNVMEHNALFRALKESNQIKITGGSPIYERFSIGENSNAGSARDTDTYAIDEQNLLGVASFSLSQYYCALSVTGTEMATNAGEQAISDLVEAKLEVGNSTMTNRLNRDLFGDGTGNGGKNLTGLGAAITATPSSGTYGGIDRSVSANSYWRPKYWNATANGGAVATSSTILSQWNSFLIQMTYGGKRPNLIIASPAVFAIFEASLQAKQQFMQAKTASAGFQEYDYKGITVTFDNAASTIGTNDAYFLNTKTFKFRPHKDFNFVMLDKKESLNQHVEVNTLVWMGNVTASSMRDQGLFRNT